MRINRKYIWLKAKFRKVKRSQQQQPQQQQQQQTNARTHIECKKKNLLMCVAFLCNPKEEEELKYTHTHTYTYIQNGKKVHIEARKEAKRSMSENEKGAKTIYVLIISCSKVNLKMWKRRCVQRMVSECIKSAC